MDQSTFNKFQGLIVVATNLVGYVAGLGGHPALAIANLLLGVWIVVSKSAEIKHQSEGHEPCLQ